MKDFTMIYHLAQLYTPHWSAFNVVHYVSFRAMAALLSTLFCSFLMGGWFIKHSQRLFRAKSREFTPDTHRAKDNLPTMGGLFILTVVFINTLFWCNLAEPGVWVMLTCLLGFGALGAWDDWYKITKKKGISARAKFILQVLFSGIVVLLWLWYSGTSWTLTFPFFKSIQPDLGWLFIPWAMFIIVGCSNAVNLTDGLDGLAIGSLMPNFILYSMLCFLAGNIKLAAYLNIPFAGTGEIAIIGCILVGASLGFLWYNTYPAQIFMGDVGSLSLGAGLALMALMCKQELLLLISGGIFVAETVSVILQVLSYRWYGRRIFKMAPMHHHFELKGWQEAKITVRFAIISLILCLLALMTIKIR